MNNHSSFHDSKAVKLLSRVGDDIGQLRQDIRSLVSHTAHHTVPNSAQEFAERARGRLSAGSNYAASRFRSIKNTSNCQNSAGIIGGVLLIGILGYGIYALSKKCCCSRAEVTDQPSEEELGPES